jgi:hypothetical protein
MTTTDPDDIDTLEAMLAAVDVPAPLPAVNSAKPVTLSDAAATFRRWLGDEYDLDAFCATAAAAAAEQLDGDPLWLLLISGSGNAKTETVAPLSGAGAHIASTISSDGALLSGSPAKQRTRDATGGLLRAIGDRGILVIKDVTSILSMNRDSRAAVLAAIREIHDGGWTRHLGTDGGRTLTWNGRIVIIGAVTTAWDRAHDVIASMGDRFLLIRMDSTEGRMSAGRQSRINVGHEAQMRSELTDAMAGVLAGASLQDVELTEDEAERLLEAANLVTLARTGVEYDHAGNVIDAHAPEMPTRFMKQLAQMVRGALAIGMDRESALRLAIRCARDSMPPLRLAILDDVAAHPASTPTEVRRRLEKPRATVDRQLQALHILGVMKLDEEAGEFGGKPVTDWRYSLADGIDPTSLRPLPDLSVQVHTAKRKGDMPEQGSDISGNAAAASPAALDALGESPF